MNMLRVIFISFFLGLFDHCLIFHQNLLGADIELGASSPLMEAATEGHVDLVRFLLERGMSVMNYLLLIYELFTSYSRCPKKRLSFFNFTKRNDDDKPCFGSR